MIRSIAALLTFALITAAKDCYSSSSDCSRSSSSSYLSSALSSSWYDKPSSVCSWSSSDDGHKQPCDLGLCQLSASEGCSMSLGPEGAQCPTILFHTTFTPRNCAYKALQYAAKQLERAQALLFSSEQANVIAEFEAMFTAITVTLYNSNGANLANINVHLASEDMARANINIPGFNRNSVANTLYYTFLAQSDSAQILYVQLSMSITDEPLAC